MLLNILISLVIFLVTTLVSYYEIKRLKLSRQFNHIPSVKEFPIIGTTYFFNAMKMTEFKRYIEEMVFSPLCKIFIGPIMVLIVSDPEQLQEITTSPAFLERPFWMRFFPWPKGLLSCEYRFWKRLRRVTNPAFSQRASISLIPIVNQHYKKYEEELTKRLDGPAFDLNEITSNISYEQILDTTFNGNSGAKQVPRKVFNEIVDVGMERARMPVIYPNLLWKMTSLSKVMEFLARTVNDTFIPAVKHRIAMNGKDVNFVDMMSRELKNGEQLTFDEIYDNSITMICAGFETTALTVAYACLMLAMHPEVEKTFIDELNENYTPGDAFDYELLKRLPYLDMIVKETLRLFSIAPFIPREALYDVEIKGIGVIPKGTVVGQVYYMLHRWEHVWGSDSDQFKPERFTPEEIAKRHPSSYMPFGSGPRACIGMQQAMINVKLALMHILSRFKFSTDLKFESLTYKFAVSLHLNQKHMVKVHKREEMY